MKRTGINTLVWSVTALCLMGAPCLARGDGGIVQLREARGPFSVTVFVSPEFAPGGLTDISVLVQDREKGQVILDADVTLAVNPPALSEPAGSVTTQFDPVCAPVAPFQSVITRATRGQASNKLLYAAPVDLRATGDWRLNVSVSRGWDTASFDCVIPVSGVSAKLAGLWLYLALPPFAVAAFALNQKLRRNSLEEARAQPFP